MPFVAPEPLAAALTERGYAEPTEVQSAVVAPALAGRDLLVSARTGSGKTVAFGLAAAPELLTDGVQLPTPGAPLALVVAPTRELALQVHRELSWLYARAGGRIASCVGGMDPRREAYALQQGTHVVVGTPGRLRDHLDRGRLVLSGCRVVVLDEADEMLDMGFREELEALLEATPPTRRTLMFSATVPPGIEALAERFLRTPERIAVGEARAHADIRYRAVVVHPSEREHAVVNILRATAPRGAIVFCATRDGVAHLHANLLERGFSAVSLSGELSQAERLRALQALRDGRASICVASDVAARGLDLPDVEMVVHADPPREPTSLLHRSGRTGRAGRKGTAVVIVPMARRRWATRLFADAGVVPDWSAPPTADQVRAKDGERLVADIEGLLPEVDDADRTLAASLVERHDPAALVAVLVHARRALLPEPEEIERSLAPPPRERAPRPPSEAKPAEAPRPPPRGEPLREGAWFRVNVGRKHGAEPRWLLPMLCGRGGVDRDAIGRIVILTHETRFEVDPAVAGTFLAATRRPEPPGRRRKGDAELRIEPLARTDGGGPAPEGPPRPPAPRPERRPPRDDGGNAPPRRRR